MMKPCKELRPLAHSLGFIQRWNLGFDPRLSIYIFVQNHKVINSSCISCSCAKKLWPRFFFFLFTTYADLNLKVINRSDQFVWIKTCLKIRPLQFSCNLTASPWLRHYMAHIATWPVIDWVGFFKSRKQLLFIHATKIPRCHMTQSQNWLIKSKDKNLFYFHEVQLENALYLDCITFWPQITQILTWPIHQHKHSHGGHKKYGY